MQRVAITTNASHLEALARPLREAGVTELNLSLDTLVPETFRAISRRGTSRPSCAASRAAVAAGCSLKLNAVVMRGVNDSEVAALIACARAHPPRFIELMPFGKGEGVPTAELVSRLSEGLALTEGRSCRRSCRARRATCARPRASAWASSAR